MSDTPRTYKELELELNDAIKGYADVIGRLARYHLRAKRASAALEEFVRLYEETGLAANDGGELVSAIHEARKALAHE